MIDKLEIQRKVKFEEFLLRLKQEKKSKIRALMLVHQGFFARQAAKEVNLSSTSVERTIHRFNEQGWEGLPDQYRGRVPVMTAEEEDEFRDRILQGPRIYENYEIILDKVSAAWNHFRSQVDLVKSLTSESWFLLQN